MRIVHPGNARPEVVDRNPLAVRQFYGANLAPHAETQRWTYTVPANRRALVALLWGQIVRESAATTVGDGFLRIKTTISAVQVSGPVLVHRNNTAGAEVHFAFGHSVYLGPGDLIELTTQDTSTGGVLRYSGGAYLIEFDV